MGEIVIERAEYTSIIMVSCWPDSQAELARELKACLGFAAPEKTNLFTENRGKLIGVIAPGRFLIVSDQEELAEQIERACSVQHSTIVDLGSSRELFRLTGTSAAELLMKGAAIDLDLDRFPAGCLFQSAIHEMGVTAFRRGPDWFDLLVYKSFAASFADWINDAGMEFS